MIKPFTPAEALQNKPNDIPDAVFEVVNELLAKHYNKSSITILQDEVVHLLEMKGFERSSIFSNKILDFEPHYCKHGWDVEFHKLPYYEEGSSFWIFKPKA